MANPLWGVPVAAALGESVTIAEGAGVFNGLARKAGVQGSPAEAGLVRGDCAVQLTHHEWRAYYGLRPEDR